MSAPMKKPLIKKDVQVVIHSHDIKIFKVPVDKVKGLVILLDDYRSEEYVTGDEAFKDLDEKYTRAGAVLQGARHKEELTQVELAKKLNITQADLSKMEHGKRTIGKKMAKKLSAILNIDYRVFL